MSMASQLIGSLLGVGVATLTGFLVYGLAKKTTGYRLSDEEEFNGADLTIHKISATFDRDMF